MKANVQERIDSLKQDMFLKRDAYEDDLKNLASDNSSDTKNGTLIAFTKTFLIYIADKENEIVDNIFNYQREKSLINASYTASITKVLSFKQKYRSLYETSKMVNFSYYPMAVNSSG